VDFAGLLLLGFLWVVFNVLTKQRSGSGRASGSGRTPLPPARPPTSGDATQREGSRLEALLRELEGALGQTTRGGPLGRPAPTPLPPDEEIEERESLESVEPEVRSLEVEPVRPARSAVNQDTGAAQVAARRIAAAAARSGPLTKADHLAFDQRIRQQPADATAVRGLTPEELRRAVVWREVLGPPVSLRREEA
jgi:hypothetical protein